MSKPDLFEAALDYAERVYPVFPLRGKKPAFIETGFDKATTDSDQINQWWYGAFQEDREIRFSVWRDTFRADTGIRPLKILVANLRKKPPRGFEKKGLGSWI